jgi:asparagine synthase (glutamine-hydrolysing)
MCGIAGIADVGGRPVDEGLVRAMASVQAHRGPDGEGFVCRGSVGLGHRRLAIIDLVSGEQPMASDDGAVWLVFNGEIYNYRELRAELEAAGQRFRSRSDTEVILRLYEELGPACVQRLRGMFAFAILDERARRVFLARDRVGIKPLVYAWDGSRLLFASEIKGILESRTVSREIDPEALADYLTYHYVPAPRTIFRSIRKLPPGSTLTLPLDGGQPTVSRYWQLHFRPDDRTKESDWLEALRFQLTDAVRCHMISDVPIGAFLSGGVDSSAVVAMMARASGKPIRTFSVGFSEADFDELAYARQVAGRYGTEHYEVVVKPDSLDVLPKLAWHFDEPFGDSSAIPTYYVSKITREHVTVALSGDGGDENFAGYRRYARAAQLRGAFDHGLGRAVRPLLGLAGRALPLEARGQAYTSLLGAEEIERYFQLVSYGRRRAVGRLLSDDLGAVAELAGSPERFRRLAEDGTASDYVARMQHVDVETYLPDDILCKVDRTSMAVSLESRVPLLDHVLMEFVATIPSGLKLQGGRGKHVFKEAMKDWLPEAVLTRPKMGFGVPLAAWFNAELRDMAHDTLLSSQARQRGIFRTIEVERLLRVHRTGRRDHSARLWALLCFELWMRRWAGEGPDTVGGA